MADVGPRLELGLPAETLQVLDGLLGGRELDGLVGGSVEGEDLGGALGLAARPQRRWEPAAEREGGGREAAFALAASRLEAAVSQLEGLPVPWSSLSRAMLPLRVPGFRLEMLDLLAANGTLVWVGQGALGPGDGRIALYRRERAPLLLAPPADEALAGAGALHRAVLEHLEQRGACFTVELQRIEGARGVSARELEAVLWDLVWAGEVTNDTFAPLRALRWKRTGRDSRRRPGRRWPPRGRAGHR